MKELISEELLSVAGGNDKGCFKRPNDLVPCAQTAYGDLANDIWNAAHELGSDIGIWTWEVIHSDE